jgi:TolB protein
VSEPGGGLSASNIPPGSTPTPPPWFSTQQIAFASDRGNAFSAFDIYKMQANGSGLTRLTFTPDIPERQPDWSSDGRIAYNRPVSANQPYKIYVMNADGTGATQVSGGTADDRAPIWSPNASKIVFTRTTASSHIIEINPDGTGEIDLSYGLRGGNSKEPRWSPDGTALLFTFEVSPTSSSIYRVNADGTERVHLTSHSDDSSPDWSPDGTKIAFCRAGVVYLMNADGSAATPNS